jgi:hypothetical protein
MYEKFNGSHSFAVSVAKRYLRLLVHHIKYLVVLGLASSTQPTGFEFQTVLFNPSYRAYRLRISNSPVYFLLSSWIQTQQEKA